MKIIKLKIENFRAIEHLDLDCSDSFNVFIGDNGVGKSTIIKAIEILYSWFSARIKSSADRGSYISEKDIRWGAPYAILSIAIEHNGIEALWTLVKARAGYKDEIPAKNDYSELKRFSQYYTTEIEEKGELNWPIMTFYGVNRNVQRMYLQGKKKKKGEPKFSFFSLYDRTHLRGTDWHGLFDWFVESENDENRMRVEFSNDYRDAGLECVRKCMAAVFPTFSSIRVASNPTRIVIEKEDMLLNFADLSDGEKCYISLICDLARRMTLAASDTDNDTQLFLVDEVDLHLHPNWQLNVIDNLRKAFPKCQFFLTTHSSLILSGLNVRNGDELIALKNGKRREISSSPYGDSSDYILKRFYAMDLNRNSEVDKLISCIKEELKKDKPNIGFVEEKLNWLRDNEVEFDEKYVLSLKLMKAKKNAENR